MKNTSEQVLDLLNICEAVGPASEQVKSEARTYWNAEDFEGQHDWDSFSELCADARSLHNTFKGVLGITDLSTVIHDGKSWKVDKKKSAELYQECKSEYLFDLEDALYQIPDNIKKPYTMLNVLGAALLESYQGR